MDPVTPTQLDSDQIQKIRYELNNISSAVFDSVSHLLKSAKGTADVDMVLLGLAMVQALVTEQYASGHPERAAEETLRNVDAFRSDYLIDIRESASGEIATREQKAGDQS